MSTKKKTARARSGAKSSTSSGDGRIAVANVNVPGYIMRVDATKYNSMRRAMLKVLPPRAPGMTQDEIRTAVVPHLPEDLFPGGAKAGWWSKSVQLDLEAKGVVVREQTRPLRWHRRART